MRVWTSLVWCFMLVSLSAALSREDGVLYDNTATGLKLWYPPQVMRNNDFPNSAPHDLVQTWRYMGMQQPGQNIVIKVVCNKISIPKVAGRNDCGEYKLTLEDGGATREFCGEVGQFTLLSQTNDISFELRTGPRGGGTVDCTAQAIPVTQDRKEITTTTSTTPKPTRPAYLDLESEEVDSSEHGGEEGDKGTTCPCGWANKISSRIVNGVETARNEFPFAAGLAYKWNRDRFCGATIISRYHALTAGHCTDETEAKDLILIVGMHNAYSDRSGPVDDIPVERMVTHPGFVRAVLSHDIALLVLQREIKFSQFVGPACLPPMQPRLQLDRQYIKIIGWGANYTMGPQSAVLQKVNVRVVPMKECNFIYRDVKVDNPTQICTYATSKASCQGDSGGPVMWVDPETNRYTHVGIVSFGRVCGDISPSVHTRVQAYLDWIQQHIRASNKPNSQTCTKIA